MTRFVAGVKCDLVIVAKTTLLPLSVTEAKKPHSEENDKHIFALRPHTTSKTVGQNFDQLHNVKCMTGFDRVYGMISTGNSFMLTCTDPFRDDELTFITHVDDDSNEATQQPHLSPSQVDPFRSDYVSALSPSENTKSTGLYSSQVLNNSEPGTNTAILNMMILQVHKAWINFSKTSGGELPGLPEEGQVYARQIELQATAPSERSGYRQNFNTVTLRPGWKQSRDMYVEGNDVVNLVRSLGSGGSGECCFGLSENQKRSCAVKFFCTEKEGPNSLEQAKNEKETWDKVYGTTSFETKVVRLGQAAGCLVMPYVKIAGLDRNSVLQDNATILRAALREFASGNNGSYILHEDVKWRHIGFFQNKLMVVDLGRVLETKRKGEMDSWIDSCVRNLTKTAIAESATDASSVPPENVARRKKKTEGTDQSSSPLPSGRSKRLKKSDAP
mmetsp:Transcript_84760/g.127076  ORF Transcript_84760/g.127076 Transcript_84760/m.127076 type:complete len:444 (+) Transcript_84760:1-1332(+)